MRKLLLSVFLIPLLFGFSHSSKNTKNSGFAENSLQISYIYRSSHSDEFIEYWNNEFRSSDVPVCNITYESYLEMYEKYQALSKEDREIVNAAPDIDEGYTIGQVIRTLVQKYYPNNSKGNSDKKKLNQSAIIIIAVVVALVGASSISILYILKNQKVIK